MPRVRSGDLTLTAAALVALVLLGAAAASGDRAADPGPPGSTFSTAPLGARAAYLLLGDLGYRVERSYEPISALRLDGATTTLVLASTSTAFSEGDARALRAFLEAGGRVLAVGGAGADALGGGTPSRAASGRRPTTPAAYRPLIPSPLTAGVHAFTMGTEGRIPVLPPGYDPIGGIEHGDAVVRSAMVGQGRGIWWAGATPLTNEAIADENNLTLLLNAVGPPGRRVVWDEHSHGYSRSLWSYAASTPLPWAALQLGVLGAAALLTFSRRFGPIRPRTVDPRTSPMEFVETMGGLYQRAVATGPAVAAARARYRRLLTARAGAASDVDDSRLASLAASRGGGDASAIATLLHDSRPGAVGSADEALAIVRRLQDAATALTAPR